MDWTECALTFDCRGDQLVGILCEPEDPGALGFVLLVGGPQYRVGSHRQYVELARGLARHGFPTLRFDFRGMGDSEGQPRDFEDGLDDDIDAALDALSSHAQGVRQIVLWGLCGGADAALMHLASRRDSRIAGVALANPWIRTEASQAKAQVKHYYASMIRDPKAWRRLLSGGVSRQSIAEFAGKLGRAFKPKTRPESSRSLSYHEAMAQGWLLCPGRPLLLLSENDLTAREFEQHTGSDAQWQQAFARVPPQKVTLRGADHTCSSQQAMADLIAACVDWAGSLTVSGTPAEAGCR